MLPDWFLRVFAHFIIIKRSDSWFCLFINLGFPVPCHSSYLLSTRRSTILLNLLNFIFASHFTFVSFYYSIRLRYFQVSLTVFTAFSCFFSISSFFAFFSSHNLAFFSTSTLLFSTFSYNIFVFSQNSRRLAFTDTE